MKAPRRTPVALLNTQTIPKGQPARNGKALDLLPPPSGKSLRGLFPGRRAKEKVLEEIEMTPLHLLEMRKKAQMMTMQLIK